MLRLAMKLLVLAAAAASVHAYGKHDLSGWGDREAMFGVAAPEPSCVPLSHTGVDYADPNLTVVPNRGASKACCALCMDYNQQGHSGPNCTVAVWHRDAGVCALKATSLKPVHGRHVQAYGAAPAAPDPSAMNLVILPNAASVDRGAVCLDGSAPAIYYRKPNTTADPGADTKWVIYFKGGGWCTDPVGCKERAAGVLGSSKALKKHQPTFTFTGPLDTDAKLNPAFANFHHVVLWYCDGGSFSGNADQPQIVNGSKVWYRGRRVLDAMLDFLQEGEYGLGRATEVLLSGGSAGGLSTFLHADYVRSKFAETVKFRAAPISGFFLNHENLKGELEYGTKMGWVFDTMNSTGGVNAGCIATTELSKQWQCIFANASYANVQTSIFPLNSAIDAWQMSNIFQMGLSCANKGDKRHQFSKCSKGEIDSLNGWEDDFLHDLTSVKTFNKPGNGGFIESCLEHCAAQGSIDANEYAIGGVTMMQALTAWWNDVDTAPAQSHWHLPCALNQAPPHQCNPTCLK